MEPGHKRGIQYLLYIFAFVFLALAYHFCCCQTNVHLLWKFLWKVYSASSFLICAKEAIFFVKQWRHGFSFKRSPKENIIILLIPIHIVAEAQSGPHKMIEFLQVAFLTSICVITIFVTKLHRNKVDTARSLERTHFAVGPGLAITFSSYLENVINGKHGSPVFVDAIRQYRQREGIAMDEGGRDWICNKVLILFPEAKKVRKSVEDIFGGREINLETRGSVADVLSRQQSEEKLRGQTNHKLCFEKVKHEYELNGQSRVSHLEMIKVFDGNRRGYVVIAENRPLNTLFSMVDEDIISEEIFKNQFYVYKNELRRILDGIEGCGENIEFFHYKDCRRLRNFGEAVIEKINSMTRENINVISFSREKINSMTRENINVISF